MSAATEAGGAVTEAMVEAGACAITRMCGHDDPYELVMDSASKSWEAPSMPRWQEWEEYSRVVLDAAAAVRPTAPGDDVEALRAEVVAPADLTSPEFGRNLFRAVIGESYTPHVWGNHRALHHTSVQVALEMADRSMPEVADVLRALIWQQVIVDNRARHASEAQRAAEDRATTAEAALAKARDCLRAADAAILELSVTAGVIARGNNRGIADFDRQAGAARGFIAAALTPTDGGAHDDR